MNEKKYIVLYTSKTGFTKKYAEWIAEALNCEAKSLKELHKEDLTAYTKVIYGGWVMGSMISGLDKLKAVYLKEPILFAVGASKPSDDVLNRIRKANNLALDDPLFYFAGGVCRKKLGFILRKMFEMGSKMELKNNSNAKLDFPLGEDFDNSKKEYIEPLLDSLR